MDSLPVWIKQDRKKETDEGVLLEPKYVRQSHKKCYSKKMDEVFCLKGLKEKKAQRSGPKLGKLLVLSGVVAPEELPGRDEGPLPHNG